jgi:hypothetical protein
MKKYTTLEFMNNFSYDLTLPCETSHRPFGEGFMELFINSIKNDAFEISSMPLLIEYRIIVKV